MRREFGIKIAQAVLGHSSVTTTENYATVGIEKAVKAMEAVG